MKNIKILSLQFEPIIDNKDKNMKKLEQMLKENQDFNSDIVLLPEVWNTGFAYKNIKENAEFIPAQTTTLLSSLAELYHTNIIAGSIFEKEGEDNFYNTSVIIDRTGAIVAKYRKNHTFSHCGNHEGDYIQNGKDITVADIEGVKIGIAICYDIRFPELFRKMIKEGTELFCIPAAFPLERIEQWNILNQARALENLSFLISCNQYGASNCISPYGKVISSSTCSQSAIRNIIDIDEVKEARNNTPFLNDIR